MQRTVSIRKSVNGQVITEYRDLTRKIPSRSRAFESLTSKFNHPPSSPSTEMEE